MARADEKLKNVMSDVIFRFSCATHEFSGGRVSTSKERTLKYRIARRKTG